MQNKWITAFRCLGQISNGTKVWGRGLKLALLTPELTSTIQTLLEELKNMQILHQPTVMM